MAKINFNSVPTRSWKNYANMRVKIGPGQQKMGFTEKNAMVALANFRFTWLQDGFDKWSADPRHSKFLLWLADEKVKETDEIPYFIKAMLLSVGAIINNN